MKTEGSSIGAVSDSIQQQVLVHKIRVEEEKLKKIKAFADYKRTQIPALRGLNEMVYTDEDKSKIFAETLEITYRTNNHPDEAMDHGVNLEKTVN